MFIGVAYPQSPKQTKRPKHLQLQSSFNTRTLLHVDVFNLWAQIVKSIFS